MDRIELLMKEYESLIQQIVHWDSHFWHKSQFFLFIQAALVAGVVQRFTSELTDNKALDLGILLIALGLALFNLFLCYVWFRTNRSNREYLKIRFDRALQVEQEIEENPELQGVLSTFHFQLSEFRLPPYRKHSSSLWETHLATAFMVVWFAVPVVAVCDARSIWQGILVGLVLAAVLLVIIVVEKTGWPSPMRWPVR